MGALQSRRAASRSRILKKTRIALLTGVLGLLLTAAWVPLPVPRSIQARLENALRLRGVTLDAKRLRFRAFQGLTVEGLSLRFAGEPSIRVRAAAATLALSWRSLLRGKLRIAAARLEQAIAELEASEPGRPEKTLRVRIPFAEAEMPSENLLRLRVALLEILGCRLKISGTIANFAAAFSLQAGKTGRKPANFIISDRFLASVENLRFASNAELRLQFFWDLQKAEKSSLHIVGQLPEAQGLPGALEGARFRADLVPAPPAEGANALRAELSLSARRFAAPHKAARLENLRLTARAFLDENLRLARGDCQITAEQAEGSQGTKVERLTAEAACSPEEPGKTNALSLRLAARNLKTPWLTADEGKFEASSTIPKSFGAPPSTVRGSLRLRSPQCLLGQAEEISVAFEAQPAQGAPSPPPFRGAPKWLDRFRLQLDAAIGGLRSERAPFTALSFKAALSPKTWSLADCWAELPPGELMIPQAVLDRSAKTLTAQVESNCDPHRLGALLPPKALAWLDRFGWRTPPRVVGRIKLRLPDLPPASPEWPRRALTALQLDAQIQGTHVSYRGVPMDEAQVRLRLADGLLQIDPLLLKRPEGEAELRYRLNLLTQDFRWTVSRCRMLPKAVAPAVDRSLPGVLAPFAFRRPAHVAGEIWGTHRPPKNTEFDLQVAVDDFSLRGERCDTAQARLSMSNRVVFIQDLRIRSGKETLQAARIAVDTRRKQARLEKVVAFADPLRLARAVGPKAERALAGCRFEAPFRTEINGLIAWETNAPSRLDFAAEGGPFTFHRFRATRLSAQVQWQPKRLVIPNLTAAFYGGQLQLSLAAPLKPGLSPFRLTASWTNTDLHSLAADLFRPDNHLSGRLNGRLAVDGGVPSDLKTWTGRSYVEVREGMLWDIPIFGVFSPLLNQISPGLGNNRATAARAHFRLRNGAVETEDLLINAGPVRIHYAGTCSLDGRLDARASIKILRPVPLIGPLVSLALTPVSKPFECRVAGAIDSPQIDLIYIPKFLRPVFSPLRFFKGLLSEPQTKLGKPPPSNDSR